MMAEADSTSKQDLKCNKCRVTLNVDSDQIQEVEGKHLDQSLIFLREDKLPEWIEKKVEEKTLMHPDEKRRRLRAEKADEMPEPTPILENIPL
jgi:hypothetical protein